MKEIVRRALVLVVFGAGSAGAQRSLDQRVQL